MLHLEGGAAMEYLVSALEKLGYKWAYRVVDSACFGIPQRRRRVFLVACVDADPRLVLLADDAGTAPQADTSGRARSYGFYWTEGNSGLGWGVNIIPPLKGGSGRGVPSPPAICMPDGSIVVPSLRDAERLQGFPAGWTAPAEEVTTRRHRWKLIGNAVNVRAARWLGRRLAHPAPVYLHGGEPLPRGSAWPSAAWNVGAGRFSAPVSPWPRATRLYGVHEYLRFAPTPLSRRATEGFLSRLLASRLRHDAAFIAALRAHLKRAS
jgi:DNA (cytosine-5)-methyltransferase 1